MKIVLIDGFAAGSQYSPLLSCVAQVSRLDRLPLPRVRRGYVVIVPAGAAMKKELLKQANNTLPLPKYLAE